VADPWPKRARQIATRLRGLREDAGLSQEQLAYAAGISRNHVQMLERGIGTWVNPRLSTLYGLADALGCRLADLLPDDAL
jgi:transcriptional regulator with XRE-family HTH domain